MRRVLGIEALFTLAASALLALLTSHFLVLSGPVAIYGAETLGLSLLAGGVLEFARCFWRLRRYRFVLRTLALGGKAVEARELFALSNEPAHVVFGWLASSMLSIGVFHTLLRPKLVDFSTGMNLALFGVVIVWAASLPLFVVVPVFVAVDVFAGVWIAVELRINANTVAKVYSHLERAGALETRRGVGTFITDRHDSERNQAARTTELRAVALRALADADARGFTAAELRRELQVISKEQQRDHP